MKIGDRKLSSEETRRLIEIDRGAMAIASSGGDDLTREGVVNILRYFTWYCSHFDFPKREADHGNV